MACVSPIAPAHDGRDWPATTGVGRSAVAILLTQKRKFKAIILGFLKKRSITKNQV
jgi:hypothetical protein